MDKGVGKPMSAAERAIWEDAEGNFGRSGYGGYSIRSSQRLREPLDDYYAGAIRDGVNCKVQLIRPKKAPRFYIAIIMGAKDVARKIKLTAPWRRHPEKVRQIRQLEERLRRQVRGPRQGVKQAREILFS